MVLNVAFPARSVRENRSKTGEQSGVSIEAVQLSRPGPLPVAELPAQVIARGHTPQGLGD
jgi:hypothetical protein